jgi:hypothetical protein
MKKTVAKEIVGVTPAALKMARENAGKSPAAVATALGMTEAEYERMESAPSFEMQKFAEINPKLQKLGIQVGKEVEFLFRRFCPSAA